MLMVLLTPASLRMAITADGEELEAFSEACKCNVVSELIGWLGQQNSLICR